MSIKTWNVKFGEDELFDDDVIRLIERRHKFKFVSAKRHVIMHKKEVDVVGYFLTITYQKRVIGFELKESDISKAVSQAAERVQFFNYFYIVINASPAFVFDMISPSEFETLKKKGIGIICFVKVNEWVPIVALPAKYHKVGLEAFMDFKVEKKGYCKTCKYWERDSESGGYCRKRWAYTYANSSCIYYEKGTPTKREKKDIVKVLGLEEGGEND